MFALMAAFSVFHLVTGTACLGLCVRLLTPEERALWRSKRALFVAELLFWIYPLIAFAAASFAWAAFNSGAHHAFPLMLAPIAWLLIMGAVFAIVDYAEDGILGNTRERG